MVVLVAGFALGATTGPIDSPPSPATKLVLTIEAYKKAVVLFEPLTLTMRVKNPTAEVIKSNVHIDRIEFFITGPDGKTETCQGNEAARGDGIK